MERAELSFVAAKKADLAVEAFEKRGDFSSAIRIARKHCPHLVKALELKI